MTTDDKGEGSTVTVSGKDIKHLHLYQMAVGMNGADND